jgi:hypothetical protein
MHRLPSAIRPGLILAREPYGDDGPQWVVTQAEAEIVVRYGDLNDGELGLTADMFDPPHGAFLVARRGHAAGPPLGGVGVEDAARVLVGKDGRPVPARHLRFVKKLTS